MRIYLRHADKQYDNGKSLLFKHDPGITDDGKEQCIQVANNLILKYGLPHIIVCSPYRRARETALMMASILPNDIIIKCDVRLSEYLGNHRTELLDVTPETMSFNPPHPESFTKMEERIRSHNDDMKFLDTSNYVIWFITHGLIINRIANSMAFNIKRKIPCLTSLVIKANQTFELLLNT